MTDLLFVPVTILYLLVVGSLFVYGINFVHLTRVAWKKGKSTLRARNEEPALSDPAPYVTVQLPIYNERYVASRLIHAAARLDYCSGVRNINEADAILNIRSSDLLLNRGSDIHHFYARMGFEGYGNGHS